MYSHTRSLGEVDYVAAARKTMKLDQDGVLLQLNVRTQFTVTTTASAPVGPKFNTLSRIIRRLEVVVGGRDTVVNIPGHMLAAAAKLEWGTEHDGMGDTVSLATSTATAYDITLPVVFWLPRGRRPDDTALDIRNVTQAVLAITWGNEDDLFTTANGATISAVTCEVEAEYLMDVPEGKAFLVRDLATTEKEISSTTNNFQIEMDRGAGILHRSYIIATTDADVGENDILNKMKLHAGSRVYRDRFAHQVRADNKRLFNQEALTDGVYRSDTYKFGEATSLIDTGNLPADLYWTFDVTKGTGTTKIEIVREAVRQLVAV